ncbi:hypothetical protein DPMN_139215 [Dreissena polymorpha]|uniref:Uncharacterized protein n=1 Tax=Dreissena polymorpha TaxID=45954 RepID=A0A9D4JKK0_DREPO|nr:hypothetical protein DPMN_139215 [Dreissena polymorpha]
MIELYILQNKSRVDGPQAMRLVLLGRKRNYARLCWRQRQSHTGRGSCGSGMKSATGSS